MLSPRIAAFALLLVSQFFLLGARADTAPALTIWRLLDYMAIDYGGAVRDGVVVSSEEYKEMVEFVGSVTERPGGETSSIGASRAP